MPFPYVDYDNDGFICLLLISITFILMILAYFGTLYAMKTAKKTYDDYVKWRRCCDGREHHLE